MNTSVITWSFIGLIGGVPIGQAVWELVRDGEVQALDVVGDVDARRLRAFEEDLQEASFIHQRVTPWYQQLLLTTLRRGNEQTILGRDDVLHYAEDLDYLVAPGVPTGNGSSIEAIVDFADQLEQVGVDLLLVPVPPKTCAQGAWFSGLTADADWIDNSTVESWYAALDAAGVEHVRVDALARESGLGPDFFLRRDTHWSPEGMGYVAAAVADRLRARIGVESQDLRAPSIESIDAVGDLAGMLRLPVGSDPFPDQSIEVPLVSRRWGTFDPSSPVLILGDSSTRVYSDPDLHLGEGSGFAERVARELRVAVDRIALVGGGARAVRESVARRAGRKAAEGGVAGKQIVVWQFSMRDLVIEDERWERIALDLEASAAATLAVPERVTVQAELMETSAVGADFDYAFALGIHEYRALDAETRATLGERFWVAHRIVEDSSPTSESNLVVGARYDLTLENVDRHHDLEQTSWVDDTDAPRRATFWYALSAERAW